MLVADIGRALAPPIKVDTDVVKTQGKNVLRVAVPKGDNPPYTLDGVEIYVRQESETSRAMRDEIVQMVRRSREAPAAAKATQAVSVAMPPAPAGEEQRVTPPRTGVEVVEVLERDGTKYYALKDLRNGNLVQNVTRSSARRLWRYAITEYETQPVDAGKVTWHGNIGSWKSRRRQGRKLYDLVQRGSDGKLHIYYGVTEDGIHGEWRQFAAEAQQS